MNPVIKGYLSNFSNEHGNFGESDEATLFEHFVNWLITSKYVDDFDIDHVHTGGGNDLGIDGLAISINSFFISDYEQALYYIDEHFKDKNLYIDFVVIQSKTSKGFDSGDIHKFFSGVENIFSDFSTSANENIKNKLKTIELIYQNSSRFTKNPTCNIFYVSLGKVFEDDNLEKIKKKFNERLCSEGIFSEVNVRYLGNDEIMKLHKGNQLKIEKKFPVLKNVSFPTVENIKEAYISIMPIKDYLNIITEDGKIISDLFYDNVRDFQGDNPVNREISDTIDSDNQKYFGFLNNGITLVTKEINKVGDDLIVNNFQIVNGCQTSTLLFDNKEKINGDSYITIKIIGTDDNEIINSIIRATNRQTEVKSEAFESLKEFHKKLEEFYLQLPTNDLNKIYYERRNKQYAQQSVPRPRVITLSAQVNAYVAMFISQPHSVHRYYGELLKANKIFNDDDELYPYYISALSLFKVDSKLKNIASSKYKLIKPFKYHMILCIRHLIVGKKYLNPASKKNDAMCEKIHSTLISDNEFNIIFDRSADAIKKVLERDFKGRKRITVSRLREFTDSLVKELDK